MQNYDEHPPDGEGGPTPSAGAGVAEGTTGGGSTQLGVAQNGVVVPGAIVADSRQDSDDDDDYENDGEVSFVPSSTRGEIH